MWALTYDYMIGYSMKDMSPEPALATAGTSDDGLTWTFDIRDGVKWSDGEPLTADDIAYTYNRVLDGGPEGGDLGLLPHRRRPRSTAPDDTTVVLKLKKPNATLPLLPIPIVPEHVWKDVSEKEVKTYAAEPEDGEPVVGSGPFRLVEGTAGGSTYRFEANPDYWGGAPHIDEVVFRVYKSEDPAVQALIKGEVDFVDGITPLQVKALQDEHGITAQNGDSPGFDEIAFNTGAVDTETGEPIGDGNPALQDPKFRHALGYALDLDQIIEKVYQGAGQPGDTIIPPAYSDWQWEPPDGRGVHLRPRQGRRSCSTRPATRWAPTASGPCPTARRSAPCGSSRAATQQERRVDTMDYFKEWLADLGIDAEVTAYGAATS